MPQFIDPESDTKVAAFLVLGATFLFTGTLWCLVLAIGALSAGAGALFVFLGLRLAASER